MAGKKAARSQKMSSKLLEELLGDSKLRRPTRLKSGEMGKGREKMKRNIVKEGRKFPGPKQPRRGYSGRSLEEQARAGVGESPQLRVEDQIMRLMGFPASEAAPGVAGPTPQDVQKLEGMGLSPPEEPDVESMILEQILQSEPRMVGAPLLDVSERPVVPIPEGMAEDDMPETSEYNYVRTGGRQYPDYARDQQLYPDYVGGTGYGPSRVGDPDFERAKAEWMQINGREPATDSELMEVESMAATGDVSRNATESEVLRTVTGTRGSQGANAHGDDENLPPSDVLRNNTGRPEDNYQLTLPTSPEEVATANIGDVYEWLGDMDNIAHLFPPEYQDAIENNDDDLRDQIEEDFIRNNPEVVFEEIMRINGR